MFFYEGALTTLEIVAIAKEFQRVGDNVYLDHAGTTLYSEKQVDACANLLKQNLFCNPHTCAMTGDLVDQVRYKILNFFNTDATQYAIVFTANATAALKLVAETFDFGKNGNFYYCQANHTSVLGMREIIQTERHFVLTPLELLQNVANDDSRSNSIQNKQGNSLLAFAAQCNFSGYKMPLEIITNVQKEGLINHGYQTSGTKMTKSIGDQNNFFVCLDAAAYVGTSFLDLQKYQPDFCSISFYKMFGYPTGVGALLVSKRGQSVLKKRYYGGGTIDISMTRENFHAKRQDFTQRFEDGTLPFLAIASLLEGFRTMERLVPATPKTGTMERISLHVFALAKFCQQQLSALKHANGNTLVKFYSIAGFEDEKTQGGTLCFNLLHADGSYIGFAEVACIAAVHNIHLRTGCFCNPGACQWFLQLDNDTLREQYAAGHKCSDYNDLVDGLPTGAVRISFGYMTQIAHVQQFVKMLQTCFLETTLEKRLSLMKNTNQRAFDGVMQRLQPKLKQICVFPIKSCGAFIVEKWPLTVSGLLYDRNWMIVDACGAAVTQKRHTRLCLISPVIDLVTSTLSLNFPGMQSLTLPLEVDKCNSSLSTKFCNSKVCSDLVEGIDCGDDVASWLNDCLETEGLRLLQQTKERRNIDGSTKDISLVNQAQFLLINRSSVNWLTNRIETEKEPLSRTVARFRANLIIETPEPFEENTYEEISIGEVIFKKDGFCTRCQMICIDQSSGQRSAEPLRTIAREFKGNIKFGIYLSMAGVPANGTILDCRSTLKIKQ